MPARNCENWPEFDLTEIWSIWRQDVGPPSRTTTSEIDWMFEKGYSTLPCWNLSRSDANINYSFIGACWLANDLSLYLDISWLIFWGFLHCRCADVQMCRADGETCKIYEAEVFPHIFTSNNTWLTLPHNSKLEIFKFHSHASCLSISQTFLSFLFFSSIGFYHMADFVPVLLYNLAGSKAQISRK